MKSQLDNLPRYSTEEALLPAAVFNKVNLGLHRLADPLCIPIHGLRHLEIEFDHETWICRDVSLNNIPVLAWTEFNATTRDSLHEDISCKLYTYHAHAMLIVDTIMEQVDIELTNRLPKTTRDASVQKLNFIK